VATTVQKSGITPLTGPALLAGPALREFFLIGGKDGSGKSSAIAALARFQAQVGNPAGHFYVLDSENKFKAALLGLGDDLPPNLTYIRIRDMNEATEAVQWVFGQYKPGDWLGIESMSRIWERAQDLGYLAVTGLEKAQYLETRREKVRKLTGTAPAPVTPQPDQLWSIAKGAHDGAFLDLIAQADDLNVALTTTISRPPREGTGFRRENQDRKEARIEFGIDSGIDGAPRLPYYVSTFCLLDLKQGQVTCKVLRDNLSRLENPRVEFPVADKRSFGYDFFSNCR
jgi:hypothetical protein